MARIDTLTNFLTDVSNAIRQKAGGSNPIPASTFDTEILSIETVGNYQEKQITITENGTFNLLPDSGYDAISNVRMTIDVDGTQPMDPTTATVDDVIAPETFYSNGQKLTGNIQVEGQAAGNTMSLSELTEDTSYYIYDICERHNLVLLSNAPISGTTQFWIGTFDSTGGITIVCNKQFTGTLTYKKINDMKFSRVDNANGYVNIFIDTNGGWSGSTYWQLIAQFDPETNEIVAFDEFSRSRTGGDQSIVSIIPHPTEDGTYILCCRRSVNAPPGLMLVKYNALGHTCNEYSYYAGIGSGGTYGSGMWNRSGTKFLWLSNFGYTSDRYEIYSYALGQTSLTRTKSNVAKSSGTNLCWLTDDYLLYGSNVIDINGTVIATIPNLTYNVSGSAMNLNNVGSIVIFNNNQIIMTSIDLTSYVVLNRLDGSNYTTWSSNQNGMLLYKPSVFNANLWLWSGDKLKKVYVDGQFVITSLNRKGTKYFNTMNATATANDILSGKKAYGNTHELVGTMVNNGSIAYTPSTSQQNIDDGYHNGSYIRPVTSDIDINIIPGNIKNGVTILGILGTYQGSQGGDATSDANLQAKYLLEGYSMVADGHLIAGTMHNYGNYTITATSNDMTIPEGFYASLSIPIINASNCEDYTECNTAILSI